MSDDLRATQLYTEYKKAVGRAAPLKEADEIAAKIEAGTLAAQYKIVSAALGGHIPPWFIGALHYREQASLSLHAFLGNGQLIIGYGEKTTIVPKGMGPFTSFANGAVAALKHVGFDKFTTWDTAQCLERFELWNGLGYKDLGKINPYIFAGTTIYTSGKFVADGVYSQSAVDKQLGVGLLMKALKIV